MSPTGYRRLGVAICLTSAVVVLGVLYGIAVLGVLYGIARAAL